jgi:hypothetical protein
VEGGRQRFFCRETCLKIGNQLGNFGIQILLAFWRAEPPVPVEALPKKLDVVLVFRSKRSRSFPFVQPSVVLKHRRFVALCRVWLLEILDLTVVVLLPAVSGGKP